ncbi:TetR/AcrR family transcriptional regulator [Saccharomonospora xinjiangensis]|uniref:TetR/AcrR family transcriptional regulator n=1 Tax=Saccharomonospora xinjiangensis TaxID=75294 RepID=UPI0006801DBD|nr:TetR/AcrR family transcriptional regulator [Saccharomonospora xinjiangensis]
MEIASRGNVWEVSSVYVGGGDPKRSMELLWGVTEKPRRGPKPRFSVEDIVAKAIELADADGIEAVTMRGVASALGLTAMSLYGYVPGKSELVDLMVDRVHAELGPPEPSGPGWRAEVEALARQAWELHLRHPWLLQVSMARPLLGPNVIAKYDTDLRAVSNLKLTPVEMDQVVTLLANYIHSAARAAVEVRRVGQDTGKDNPEWWTEYEPLLAKVLDAERFPMAGEVGNAVGEEYYGPNAPELAFEFGLEVLLDGIAVLVDRAARRGEG